MTDVRTYRITLHSQVALEDVSAGSPIALTLEKMETTRTHLSVCCDQSGLVGLIRHLHNLGLVLLAITCQEAVENGPSQAH